MITYFKLLCELFMYGITFIFFILILVGLGAI